MLIESDRRDLSIRRQCELLDVARSSYYHEAQNTEETEENLAYMRRIDEQYMKTPFFGSRQMTAWLNRQGYAVNRKRIQRLMRLMGIQGSVPGPQTSKPHPHHPTYPYLLCGMRLEYANLVWSTDITYVPMPIGFMYLVAVVAVQRPGTGVGNGAAARPARRSAITPAR